MQQIGKLESILVSKLTQFVGLNKLLLIFVISNSIPQLFNVFVYHLLSVKLDLMHFNLYNHFNYTINLSAVFILLGQQDLLSRSFLRDDLKVAASRYAKVLWNTLVINLIVTWIIFSYLRNDFINMSNSWLYIFLSIFTLAIDGVNKLLLIIKNKPWQFFLINIISYILYYFLVQNALNNKNLNFIFLSFSIPAFISSILILLINFNKIVKLSLIIDYNIFKPFYFSTINKISLFSFSSTLLVYFSSFSFFAILKYFGEARTLAQYSSYIQLFTILLFIPNLYQKFIFRQLGSYEIPNESKSIKKLITEGSRFIVIISLFIFAIIFIANMTLNFFPYLDKFYYILILANLILYLFSLAPSGLWLLSNKMNYSFILNLNFFITLISGILILVYIEALSFTNILLLYFLAYLLHLKKTKFYTWKILQTHI